VENLEISLDRPFKRLINGRLMTCPRCKRDFDILQFKRLLMIEEFAKDTTPIYKCPTCSWLVAPADDIVALLLGRFSENGAS
jgi:hypothetical protein